MQSLTNLPKYLKNVDKSVYNICNNKAGELSFECIYSTFFHFWNTIPNDISKQDEFIKILENYKLLLTYDSVLMVDATACYLKNNDKTGIIQRYLFNLLKIKFYEIYKDLDIEIPLELWKLIYQRLINLTI